MLLDLLCSHCLGSMYKTSNAICIVSAECVQGWRLEVKGYPKLTEHGAWRGRGTHVITIAALRSHDQYDPDSVTHSQTVTVTCIDTQPYADGSLSRLTINNTTVSWCNMTAGPRRPVLYIGLDMHELALKS